MKDEIKEILEIQEDSDYKKLSIEDILLLKEHIEKLEKKVELYQDTTTFGDYVGSINNLIELQGRINKAIKLLKETEIENSWFKQFKKKQLEILDKDKM